MTKLYTWKDVRARDLQEMRVSERDLANLGLAVLARLRAVWEQGHLATPERKRRLALRKTQGR